LKHSFGFDLLANLLMHFVDGVRCWLFRWNY